MVIKSLTAPSAYTTSVAAHMVDVLVAHPAFQPGQMRSPRVVWPRLEPSGGLFLP